MKTWQPLQIHGQEENCQVSFYLKVFLSIVERQSLAKVVDVLLRVDHNHDLKNKNTEPSMFVVKTVAF